MSDRATQPQRITKHDLEVVVEAMDKLREALRVEEEAKPAPSEQISGHEWPDIPSYLTDPIIFRDKNLGLAMVAGYQGKQWVFKVNSGNWMTVRPVGPDDPMFIVDALNQPPREPLASVAQAAQSPSVDGLEGQHASYCALSMDPNATACDCQPAKVLSELLCPPHANLDANGHLKPFDNCIACIRAERDELRTRDRELVEKLEGLAAKWDSADYAIAEVSNPLLPQEQCAIELRAVLAARKQ